MCEKASLALPQSDASLSCHYLPQSSYKQSKLFSHCIGKYFRQRKRWFSRLSKYRRGIPGKLPNIMHSGGIGDSFKKGKLKWLFLAETHQKYVFIYIYLLMNLIFPPPPVPSSLKWAGIASGELNPALWRIIWIRTSGALLSQLLPQTILTSCIIRHFFKAAFQNLKSIVSFPFIQVWRLGV